MKIRTEQLEIPQGRRLLVTSDIHGHISLLQRLLERAVFSDGDMLFILGDIIEKGPQSLETLRFVMRLAEQENVTVLMGNVDLSRVQMLENLSEESCGEFYDLVLMMRE